MVFFQQQQKRYTIDGVVGEDLTLYVNNVYQFDISAASLASNPFALSAFPGGAYGRGLVENITANVPTSSQQVTVSDSSAIIAGMEITVVSGNAQLQTGTKVQSVDNATTITIDLPAAVAGSAVLGFAGTEYTDNVIRTAADLTIKVTSTTPNLYYYSQTAPNLGGTESYEGLLTINQNNPKTFGSEAEFLAFDIASDDVIKSDVETGILTVNSAVGDSLAFDAGTIVDLRKHYIKNYMTLILLVNLHRILTEMISLKSLLAYQLTLLMVMSILVARFRSKMLTEISHLLERSNHFFVSIQQPRWRLLTIQSLLFLDKT